TGCRPDRVESLEQGNLVRIASVKDRPVEQQRLQRRRRITVTGRLAATQCPGIATQEGQQVGDDDRQELFLLGGGHFFSVLFAKILEPNAPNGVWFRTYVKILKWKAICRRRPCTLNPPPTRWKTRSRTT